MLASVSVFSGVTKVPSTSETTQWAHANESSSKYCPDRPENPTTTSLAPGRPPTRASNLPSGDMAAAPQYVPKGTPASVLRYWWPGSGKGPINNDMLAVIKGAKNPVLAHLFLNHIINTQEAFTNFSYTGYQQPVDAMTPEALVKEKLIPPTLQTTLIQRSQFDNGYVEGALSQSAQVLWENAWAAVKSA